MILPELNKIAVWRPLNVKGLAIKPMDDYPYLSNGKKQTGSVVRYAKDYQIEDRWFSLIVVSQSVNIEAIEKFLDKIASTTPIDLCDGRLYKTDKVMNI